MCRPQKRFSQSRAFNAIILLCAFAFGLFFPSINASYEEEYKEAWLEASAIEVQIGQLEGQWDGQIVTLEMLLEYHELKSQEEELRARMRELKSIMEKEAMRRRIVLYPFIE